MAQLEFLLRTTALAVALLFASSAVGAPALAASKKPDTGKALLLKRQYKKAAAALKTSAEAGNAAAQYQLGSLYRLGLGVDADTRKARFWFQKSAAQGHVKATRALKRLTTNVPPTEKKMALRGNSGSSPATRVDLSALPKRPVAGQDWLTLAAARNLPQTVTALLQSHPDQSETAIAAAIKANQPVAVSAILDAGDAKIAQSVAPVAGWVVKPGRGPVLAAVLTNRPPAAVAGAALVEAVHACNGEAVKALAAVSPATDAAAPPLPVEAAVSCPDAMAVLPLLDSATLSATDKLGRTSLWHAAYGNTPAAVSYLLQQHVDAAASDSAGLTPVHASAIAARADNLELLLAATNNADLASTQGLTPLMLAAASGCDACIPMLLARGAQVSAKDEQGNTALMYAVHADHASTVKLLLKAGANPAARNESGDTPEKAWSRLHKTKRPATAPVGNP